MDTMAHDNSTRNCGAPSRGHSGLPRHSERVAHHQRGQHRAVRDLSSLPRPPSRPPSSPRPTRPRTLVRGAPKLAKGVRPRDGFATRWACTQAQQSDAKRQPRPPDRRPSAEPPRSGGMQGSISSGAELCNQQVHACLWEKTIERPRSTVRDRAARLDSAALYGTRGAI
eukprot:COSAG02_NODE_15664_length_1150_cov_1.484301_2_plen_169_part_00